MSKLSVNELTDETGTGAPSFPNGMSVTGAALTDPEITGGIFLGGTGSANKLEDYEEGNWTTTISDAQNLTSLTFTRGKYTKIGNLVTITGFFDGTVTSTLAETRFVFTLPFNVGRTNWTEAGSVSLLVGSGVGRFGVGVITNGAGNSSRAVMYFDGNQVQKSGATGWIHFSFTYQTS